MKRAFLLTIAIGMLAVTANAQNFIKRDLPASFSLSGVQVERWSSFTELTNFSEMRFDIYYFISDKLAIDTTINYNIDYDSGSLGVGLRYYPVGNVFAAIVPELSFYTGTTPTLGLQVGYDVFFSKHLYLEMSAYYRRLFDPYGGTDLYGLSFGIGFLVW